MSATGLHISISAEPIFYLGDFPITNSMLTSLVVTGLIIAFAVIANRALKETQKPQPMQNFAEWVVETLLGFVGGITNDTRKTHLFFPVIASFFIFIIINNWFGLLPGVGTIMVPLAHLPGDQQTEKLEDASHQPANESVVPGGLEALDATEHEAVDADTGDIAVTEVGLETDSETQDNQATVAAETELVESAHSGTSAESEHRPAETTLFRPATADLNTTIALGIVSILATQLFGFHFLNLGYLSKFFNFSNPIMFFVGILELVSEFAKIISFAFRLFGNVFAGEVLLVVIMYLTKIIVPVPFYGLEVFVGFIQALVFAMLSVVFFNMATQSHEEH